MPRTQIKARACPRCGSISLVRNSSDGSYICLNPSCGYTRSITRTAGKDGPRKTSAGKRNPTEKRRRHGAICYRAGLTVFSRLVGTCLSNASKQILHICSLSKRHLPAGLVILSAVLLAGGIVAWIQGSRVASVSFVHETLAADMTPDSLSALFRTVGIVSTVLGSLVTLSLIVIHRSRPDTTTIGDRWAIGVLGGFMLAVGLGLWLESESLAGVPSIAKLFPGDSLPGDIASLFLSIGIAATTSGGLLLSFPFLIIRRSEPNDYQLSPYDSDRRFNLLKPVLFLMGIAIVLYLGLVGFHWSRGYPVGESLRMVVRDVQVLVACPTEPQALIDFVSRSPTEGELATPTDSWSEDWVSSVCGSDPEGQDQIQDSQSSVAEPTWNQ